MARAAPQPVAAPISATNVASLIDDVRAKTERHVWRHMTPHAAPPPAPVVTARGSTLHRLDGSEALDSMAGLWCVNVGYGREELAATAYDAMNQLSFLSPALGSVPQVELAAKISDLLDYDRPAHAFFTASGSEANEAAFKVARMYHAANIANDPSGPLRHKIIARHRAYHGNTAGAMAATGQAERKIGFGPQPPGYLHVPPPYPYRASTDPETHCADVVRQLDETISFEGSETVAAFIAEPVMSGGGVLVPPEAYLKGVREVCDKHGVLLILDEVVSGFGRTGAMFGHQHYGVTPDIITMAKGLTSGYQPLGACVVTADVFDRFRGDADAFPGKVETTLPKRLQHFRQINTYGGHPVACAVALKNLEIIEREQLVERAASMGDFLTSTLERDIGDHPNVGEVRGKGLLIGVELVKDRATKEPLDEPAANAIVARCADAGVVIGRNGSTIPGLGNVLILAPPFVITEDECVRLSGAIRDALQG